MEELFFKLKYPFVYLDRSYILRNNISEAQLLTRRLLQQDPNQFHKIIENIRARSECDSLYYQQIHALQQADIISSLITCEVFHESIIPVYPKVIPLFGQYSALALNISIILWGEKIHRKEYINASTTLLDAKCIVADVAFFDLVVSKELRKYIINDNSLFLIGSSPGNKKGDTHMVYEVSPQSFINALYSTLK